MAEINWTPEAERWLRDIHDYISRDSSAAALRTIEGICQKVQTLRDAPEWGYRYEHISDRNVRILLYGH